jgi:signal transduction histidine kinase
MRERVETVGGSWELRSSPGEGTVVRAVFAGRASGSAEGDGPAASAR